MSWSGGRRTERQYELLWCALSRAHVAQHLQTPTWQISFNTHNELPSLEREGVKEKLLPKMILHFSYTRCIFI